MSGLNPTESVKSQNQENPITHSQDRKNTELAKFVAQNQIGPLKPKKTVSLKEKVTKDNFESISNKDETNISFQTDNISSEKTLTLFNEINKDIIKYTNLFKILSSKLSVMKYKNSPWKTMITKGEKKKQEKMKNLNQRKNLENLTRNIPFEPSIKRSRGRPRNNVFTDFKNTPSQTNEKRGRTSKQIIEDELPEIYTKNPNQIGVGSDSDSDPEYLDYLKIIQAKIKERKIAKSLNSSLSL